MSINRAILIGRLGKDPELRFTQNGKQVANFTIATNETWYDKESGKRTERTEWHKVVAWGRTAEVVSEHLSKGRQICVEGRIQTRDWEDKNGGGKRTTTEIIANRITFLGGGRRDDEQVAA